MPNITDEEVFDHALRNVIVPFLSKDIQILVCLSEVNKLVNQTIKNQFELIDKPKDLLGMISQLQGDYNNEFELNRYLDKQVQFLRYYREVIKPKFKGELTKNAFGELSEEDKMLYILLTNNISKLAGLECKTFKAEDHRNIHPGLIKNINITLTVAEKNNTENLRDIKEYFVDEKPDSDFHLNLQGADFCFVNLNFAYLRFFNFQGAYFYDADLRNVHFSYADLRKADFSQALLQDAHFEYADLRGASFKLANLQGADLRGANFQEANFLKAKLKNCCVRLAKGLDSLCATAPELALYQLKFFDGLDFYDENSLKMVLDKYKNDSAAIFGNASDKTKSDIYHAIVNSLVNEVNYHQIEKRMCLFSVALTHPFFNQLGMLDKFLGFFNIGEFSFTSDCRKVLKEEIKKLNEALERDQEPMSRNSMNP